MGDPVKLRYQVSGFLDPHKNPAVKITSEEKGALLLNKDNFSTFVKYKNNFLGDVNSAANPYSADVKSNSTYSISSMQPNFYSSTPKLSSEDYNVTITTLRQKGSTTTSQTFYFLVTNFLDNIITEKGERLITHLYNTLLIEYYGTIRKSIEYNTTISVRTS